MVARHDIGQGESPVDLISQPQQKRERSRKSTGAGRTTDCALLILIIKHANYYD
jgi:hypothetical protein